MELKPCPFCGGNGKISFKDYKFAGFNGRSDRKMKYRLQVICNKCRSRGKPIVTDWLINPSPYITIWGNNYYDNDRCNSETEKFRLYADEAVKAWNRRANDV